MNFYFLMFFKLLFDGFFGVILFKDHTLVFSILDFMNSQQLTAILYKLILKTFFVLKLSTGVN